MFNNGMAAAVPFLIVLTDSLVQQGNPYSIIEFIKNDSNKGHLGGE
jgi:hypothetical protein